MGHKRVTSLERCKDAAVHLNVQNAWPITFDASETSSTLGPPGCIFLDKVQSGIGLHRQHRRRLITQPDWTDHSQEGKVYFNKHPIGNVAPRGPITWESSKRRERRSEKKKQGIGYQVDYSDWDYELESWDAIHTKKRSDYYEDYYVDIDYYYERPYRAYNKNPYALVCEVCDPAEYSIELCGVKALETPLPTPAPTSFMVETQPLGVTDCRSIPGRKPITSISRCKEATVRFRQSWSQAGPAEEGQLSSPNVPKDCVFTALHAHPDGGNVMFNFHPVGGYVEGSDWRVICEICVPYSSCPKLTPAPSPAPTTTTTTTTVDLQGLDGEELEVEIADEEAQMGECMKWCYSKKHKNKAWEGTKCKWHACKACPEC